MTRLLFKLVIFIPSIIGAQTYNTSFYGETDHLETGRSIELCDDFPGNYF